jgi:hypothetical protein
MKRSEFSSRPGKKALSAKAMTIYRKFFEIAAATV